MAAEGKVEPGPLSSFGRPQRLRRCDAPVQITLIGAAAPRSLRSLPTEWVETRRDVEARLQRLGSAAAHRPPPGGVPARSNPCAHAGFLPYSRSALEVPLETSGSKTNAFRVTLTTRMKLYGWTEVECSSCDRALVGSSESVSPWPGSSRHGVRPL